MPCLSSQARAISAQASAMKNTPGGVEQLVVQRTLNPSVGGSSPSAPAKALNREGAEQVYPQIRLARSLLPIKQTEG